MSDIRPFEIIKVEDESGYITVSFFVKKQNGFTIRSITYPINIERTFEPKEGNILPLLFQESYWDPLPTPEYLRDIV